MKGEEVAWRSPGEGESWCFCLIDGFDRCGGLGAIGWKAGGGIAVDAVHNVLVSDGALLNGQAEQAGTVYNAGRNTILIFDRTANGDAKPLRVIRGPKTGLIAIRHIETYPKNGWILLSQLTDAAIPEPEGTFVGVWSIADEGDVPPRWKIEGKPGNVIKKPHGIALNPRDKEMYVSDMRLNAVVTFYFPEIF